MSVTTYLGDSVYAEFDGFGIILTTNNGSGPTNTIYLEPATYHGLTKFVEQLQCKPLILNPDTCQSTSTP